MTRSRGSPLLACAAVLVALSGPAHAGEDYGFGAIGYVFLPLYAAPFFAVADIVLLVIGRRQSWQFSRASALLYVVLGAPQLVFLIAGPLLGILMPGAGLLFGVPVAAVGAAGLFCAARGARSLLRPMAPISGDASAPFLGFLALDYLAATLVAELAMQALFRASVGATPDRPGLPAFFLWAWLLLAPLALAAGQWLALRRCGVDTRWILITWGAMVAAAMVSKAAGPLLFQQLGDPLAPAYKLVAGAFACALAFGVAFVQRPLLADEFEPVEYWPWVAAAVSALKTVIFHLSYESGEVDFWRVRLPTVVAGALFAGIALQVMRVPRES